MKTLLTVLSNYMSTYAAVIICVSLCILVPYLLGSVNFALVISKTSFKDDIREHGSGNAGMTNMLRTYGKVAALATLLCDMFKGAVAVIFGNFLIGYFGAYMAGFFCIFGHIFPIFFKFKGGKGVATLAAIVLTLDLMQVTFCFLLLFSIFLILVIGTKYVSLGSVICCMIYPIIVARIGAIGFQFIFSFLSGAIIVFMHRENIKRLLNHTENKISLSKKSKEKK